MNTVSWLHKFCYEHNDITGVFIEECNVNSSDIYVGKRGKTRCPYIIQVYFKNGIRKTYKLL